MPQLKRLARALTVCIGVSLWSVSSVLACPLCKEAVGAAGSGAGNLASGFFWSIIAMIALPFALVGVVTYAIISAYRRVPKPDSAAASTSDPQPAS